MEQINIQKSEKVEIYDTDSDYVKLMKTMLNRSIDDFNNGRYMTLEESKRRMREKYGLNI